MLIANRYLLLQRVEGTGVEGRQGTAVIYVVMLMCNVYVCWALLKTSLLADAVSHYMNYELLAVVHSCQNHVDKTLVNQLSCGFNLCLSQTFFQYLDRSYLFSGTGQDSSGKYYIANYFTNI